MNISVMVKKEYLYFILLLFNYIYGILAQRRLNMTREEMYRRPDTTNFNQLYPLPPVTSRRQYSQNMVDNYGTSNYNRPSYVGNRYRDIVQDTSSDEEIVNDNNSYNHSRVGSPEDHNDDQTNNCIPSITTSRGRNFCKNDIIFEEYFNYLNHRVWSPEVRIPLESEAAEFLLYYHNAQNCHTQNGRLYIVPKFANSLRGIGDNGLRVGEVILGPDCTRYSHQECYRRAFLQAILPPIVSSKINTKNSFSFKYGHIDIGAKFPKGDWLFPQLYLEPMEHAYGSTGYASGQMRIGFIRSNEFLESKDFVQINGNRLSGGFILSPEENLRDLWMESILSDTNFSEKFHVYTLVWTDENISVKVDGRTYANYPLRSILHKAQINNIPHIDAWNKTESIGPFDKEFYISLGVGVGGMFDFPDDCRTGINKTLKPWLNRSPKAELQFWLDKDNWKPTWNTNSYLQVDFVRVYAV